MNKAYMGNANYSRKALIGVQPPERASFSSSMSRLNSYRDKLLSVVGTMATGWQSLSLHKEGQNTTLSYFEGIAQGVVPPRLRQGRCSIGAQTTGRDWNIPTCHEAKGGGVSFNAILLDSPYPSLKGG